MDLWTPPPHPRPRMAPGGRHGEKSPYVWSPTAALGVYLAWPQGLCILHCPRWVLQAVGLPSATVVHCGNFLREAGGEGRQEARGLTDGRRAIETHPVITRSASASRGLARMAGW